MGSPWIHRLSNVDLESGTAECSNCGPVGLHLRSGRLPGCSEARRIDKIWEAIRAHGVSREEWHELLISQSGRCGSCGDPMTLPCIDHDHRCCPGSTGCSNCVRGLVCSPCNLMLGNAMDDPARLRAGAEYLERWL